MKQSRRELAKLWGKLLWFSLCLAHVKLLSREMSKYIGSPQCETAWDLGETLLERVREELAFGGNILVRIAQAAKPIWRMPPQRLRELFPSGEPAVSHVVTTNASYQGWGAKLTVEHEG